MQKEAKTICIVAGGTKGHLLPAEQLALLLKQKLYHPVFAGAGLKKNPFFSGKDFIFYEIPSANFQAINKILPFFRLIKATFQAIKLLRKIKPKAVVGFGSYHTFPVLLAAYFFKIPIYLFEPNCILGKVNAFFAKKAKAVAVQFPMEEYQKPYFKQVTPLPWIYPSQRSCLEKKRFTLLVFGGSQGAKSLNEKVPPMLIKLAERKKSFTVIHLTGKEKGSVEITYREAGIPAKVLPYEEDMASLYEQADFVIARSGASTLAELIHYEIPALLIPYPFSTKQHQQINACFFQEKVKGGKFVLDSMLQSPSSQKVLEELWKDLPSYQKQIQAFKNNYSTHLHLVDLITQEKS